MYVYLKLLLEFKKLIIKGCLKFSAIRHHSEGKKNYFEHFTVYHLLTFKYVVSLLRKNIYILNSKLFQFIYPSWRRICFCITYRKKFYLSVVSQHSSILRVFQPADNLTFQMFFLFDSLSMIRDLWRLNCHLCSFVTLWTWFSWKCFYTKLQRLRQNPQFLLSRQVLYW